MTSLIEIPSMQRKWQNFSHENSQSAKITRKKEKKIHILNRIKSKQIAFVNKSNVKKAGRSHLQSFDYSLQIVRWEHVRSHCTRASTLSNKKQLHEASERNKVVVCVCACIFDSKTTTWILVYSARDPIRKIFFFFSWVEQKWNCIWPMCIGSRY